MRKQTMKNILAAAAITLMTSTAAFADAHTTLETYTTDAMTGDMSASEIIGMRVYSAERDYDGFTADSTVLAGAEAEWDDIGEVNDIILNRDGSVKAVVLGVGGFIGIGEKDVAIPMSGLKMVNEQDDPGDYFLVVKTTKEALEAAPEYDDPEDVAEAAAETQPVVDTNATAVVNETDKVVVTDEVVATDAARLDGDRTMLMRPMVEREGYEMAEVGALTTEELTGARVYGANDEDIGEIGELIVDDSGKITKAVIDVGGFIGIGEKPIAVTMDELNIMRDADGDTRVYIDATKEALEAQPDYEG